MMKNNIKFNEHHVCQKRYLGHARLLDVYILGKSFRMLNFKCITYPHFTFRSLLILALYFLKYKINNKDLTIYCEAYLPSVNSHVRLFVGWYACWSVGWYVIIS